MDRLKITAVFILFLSLVSSAQADPFVFAVMADSRGSNNGVNDSVLSDIAALVQQTDAALVCFPGDLVTGSSTGSVLTSQLYHWRDIMAPLYGKVMYGSKIYTSPGNHEISNSGSEAIWQSIFNDLPFNGPAGETYMTYSFDYENAHFIMLDTDRASQTHTINYDWLAADLASTNAEHIFVFGHDPAFPAGPHLGSSLDAYPTARDAFWQLLSNYNVDVYFAGHEHLYNHVKVDGVHQIITGTCGAPIYTGYGGDFYHFALVTVDGPDVFVKIIDDAGHERDYFFACREDPILIEGRGLYFNDLQLAYNSTESGDVIKMQASVLTGNLDMHSDRHITLSGGFNCNGTVDADVTTLHGSITVTSGTAAVENLIIY